MKQNEILKALAVIFGIGLGVAAVALAPDQGQQLNKKKANASTNSTLMELASYKSWRLVNASPYLMDPSAASLCAVASLANSAPSPHDQKWVSVFVNASGVDAMTKQLEPSFPIGTMIVKEKHATADSSAPELLTAMVKRSHGYYPQGGDWEYFVLDGSASKILSSGKQDSCNSCHLRAKASDYVLRPYLSAEMQNNLH